MFNRQCCSNSFQENKLNIPLYIMIIYRIKQVICFRALKGLSVYLRLVLNLVYFISHKTPTIHSHICRVRCFSDAVGSSALIDASIFHLNVANVNMTDNVPMQGHILSYQESVEKPIHLYFSRTTI